MAIHQISVTPDERQDRLLLRISTQQGQEFRFWLTRRLVIRLLPVLEQAAQQMDLPMQGVLAQDEHTRQMLSEFQRENFMQRADFQTPYAAQNQDLPLGEQPMLPTDVQLTALGKGELLLALKDKSTSGGLSCQLTLHTSLLHGLVHLMGQAASQIDWGLEPLVSASPAKSDTTAAKPPYRH